MRSFHSRSSALSRVKSINPDFSQRLERAHGHISANGPEIEYPVRLSVAGDERHRPPRLRPGLSRISAKACGSGHAPPARQARPLRRCARSAPKRRRSWALPSRRWPDCRLACAHCAASSRVSEPIAATSDARVKSLACRVRDHSAVLHHCDPVACAKHFPKRCEMRMIEVPRAVSCFT